MKKPLTFSYTSLRDYDNCPLAYQQKYILKTFPPFVKTDAIIWGDRVHKSLEMRMKDGTPLLPELAKFEPMMNKFLGFEFKAEWSVCLNKDLKPTGFWDEDAWLRGKIDLSVRVSPTVKMVCDWKSGKRKPDFDQLELFALFEFTHDSEIDECRSAFVWTQDGKMDTETYRRKDTDRLWEKFIGKITRIHRSVESDNWPAKPSGLCKYCAHKPNCRYAR